MNLKITLFDIFEHYYLKYLEYYVYYYFMKIDIIKYKINEFV